MKIKTRPARGYEKQQEQSRGKFIPISDYIQITESSQINRLMMHLKFLEKQEQVKHKIGRQKEIIKITAGITEIEIKQKPYKESIKQEGNSL